MVIFLVYIQGQNYNYPNHWSYYICFIQQFCHIIPKHYNNKKKKDRRKLKDIGKEIRDLDEDDREKRVKKQADESQDSDDEDEIR